jgi:hypothetical protein
MFKFNLQNGRGRPESCNRLCPAPFPLTLRGPSGGHCVELHGGPTWLKLAIRWGPLRDPQRVELFYSDTLIIYQEAPRSGPRRAPGGSVGEEGLSSACNVTIVELFRTVQRRSELEDYPIQGDCRMGGLCEWQDPR